MKYCLVVYLKDECHEIQGFSKIPGFEHLDETKIKDIVSFTNEFETEQQLICYLIETGLLPEKFFKGTIGINYYKGKMQYPKHYNMVFLLKKIKNFLIQHFYNIILLIS